jgi:RNA polymerase sigma-70 factor, ECF subfamily
MLKVLEAPERLLDARRPWPYLITMVRNESLQLLRKRRWRPAPHGVEDLVTVCPVDELEREDTYRLVWKAIRGLPREQSEVVVLKIWEGFSFAQIAAVVGAQLPTITSRYRYAMTKLESSLRREGVGRGAS